MNIVSAIGETNVKKEKIYVPNHGYLNLEMESNWFISINQPENNLPPTIEITTSDKKESMFLITVLWNAENDKPQEADKIKSLVEKDGNELIKSAEEKTLTIKEIKGRKAYGFYFLLTDKAPKPGEFKYIVRSGVGVGNLLLSATFLSNNKDSEDIKKALIMLKNAEQQVK